MLKVTIPGKASRAWSQATGQPEKQAAFAPLPPGFLQVPPNDLQAMAAAMHAGTAAVMAGIDHAKGEIIIPMDGDGQNIRPLSSNVEHDNTPWLLPDGRILYMRWEYVDRSQVHFHHLWTMNPDGTGQTVYFGNMHGGIAMLDLPGDLRRDVHAGRVDAVPEFHRVVDLVHLKSLRRLEQVDGHHEIQFI